MFSPSRRRSERSRFADEAVHFNDARLERVLPAEGEQLGRQVGGAVGGAANFSDVLRGLAFHPEFVQKQIAVAEDGGEKIIEVVRDAAGQLAERFHLLRTEDLILQLLARGDVHERADETHRCAVRQSRTMRARSRRWR